MNRLRAWLRGRRRRGEVLVLDRAVTEERPTDPLADYTDWTELARGGSSVVFRAWEPRFKRWVVIKKIQIGLGGTSRSQFERECDAIGALAGHPNIVNVYAAWLSSEREAFIVMEYLPDGTLADQVAEKRLDWRQAAAVGVCLGGALESAHRLGVLHLDVKPENVFLRRDYDAVKLGDFGIASIAGQTGTVQRNVAGTLLHIAPERLNLEEATPASDVYSLGSTLFTVLAGAPPFGRADEPPGVIVARVTGERRPPVPDLSADGVPASLCRVIEQALAQNPGHRPSAGEMAQQLQLVQESEGLAATPLMITSASAFDAPPSVPSQAHVSGADTVPPQRDALDIALDSASSQDMATTGILQEVVSEALPTPLDAEASAPEPETAPVRVECYWHADRTASWRTCTYCSVHRRYCDDCLVRTPVGLMCREHAARRSRYRKRVMVSACAVTLIGGIAAAPTIRAAFRSATTTTVSPTTFPPTTPPTTRPPAIGTFFIENRNGNWDIYYLNYDTGRERRLTTDPAQDVDLSTNYTPRTFVAFSSNRAGDFDIYVMDSEGNNQRPLTTATGADRFPDWSPRQTYIVFESARDGDTELYIMNADGSNQTRLTYSAGYDGSPEWTSNVRLPAGTSDLGSDIAFVSTRENDFEIYTIKPDGSALRRLTTTPGKDDSPAWSPDGTRLAFVSEREGNREIYVMNADGSSQTRLTEYAAKDEAPKWSPNGDLITFRSDRDGTMKTYTMRPDGTGVTLAPHQR